LRKPATEAAAAVSRRMVVEPWRCIESGGSFARGNAT